MMDGSAVHYWLVNARLPICSRTSGYATTDAREVSCGICQRIIRQRWKYAESDRVNRAIAWGRQPPGRWPKKGPPGSAA